MAGAKIAGMKYGIRRRSIKRSISARLSVTRRIRDALGLRAPKGLGWATNPRRAAYNRTTFSLRSLLRDLLR
jgi:hypothetical protein